MSASTETTIEVRADYVTPAVEHPTSGTKSNSSGTQARSLLIAALHNGLQYPS